MIGSAVRSRTVVKQGKIGQRIYGKLLTECSRRVNVKLRAFEPNRDLMGLGKLSYSQSTIVDHQTFDLIDVAFVGNC